MTATTPPSPDPEQLVRRFTRGERWLHFSFAALMGVAIGTAALLYLDPLSALVGRRQLVSTVHLVSGLLLPVPLLVAVLTSAAFRADTRQLDRFVPADRRWLRSAVRGDLTQPSGKFNAGQKLNSAFVLGALVVMFGTGLLLHYATVIPDTMRTGATFVHDLFATAVVIVAAGHIWRAMGDPEARRGLSSGWVSRRWAQREHSLWRPPEESP